jgi:hypothetical protein
MDPVHALRAIEMVARSVRDASSDEEARRAALVPAITAVAGAVTSHGTASVQRALSELGELLLQPIDPSDIAWNAFRMFDVADKETAWTQWIAGILSPESGTELSAIAWRSLCDAVAQGGEPQACVDDENLATLADWRAMRDVPLPNWSVATEEADPDLGRTDITVNANGMFIIVENKLDADWHDGSAATQAERYRNIGMKRRQLSQRLGLVLLTKRDAFEMEEHCRDYIKVTYRGWARSLRRSLRGVGDMDPRRAIALAPALLTVAAIEQDLLGITIKELRDLATGQHSWKWLKPLADLIAHLRNEENR